MSDQAVTVREYDPFAPENLADQIAFLHRVRAESPLAWVPKLDSYLLTRHDDVMAALRDKRLDTANMSRALQRLTPAEQEELAPIKSSLEMWMGHTVPADHHRFQQLLKRYFTPAMVDRLRPRVREITHELLDAVAGKGEMDVVRDLAYPLPANVIAEMLGMPTSHREQLQAWSRAIMPVFGLSDVDALRESQASMLEFHDYLRELAAERRTDPRDDVLSMFMTAEAEGTITEDEAVANCVLLLFAGHETTANLIANGLVLLFENPSAMAALRDDPSLTPAAVEEMLRLDGPAGVIGRRVIAPYAIHGHDLPVGSHIFLALNAANRDPEVFPDPDRFDLTRGRGRVLSFGMGTYYCLGAALARMETDECFRILLDRMPQLAPAYDRPDFVLSAPVGHRLETLHVTF